MRWSLFSSIIMVTFMTACSSFTRSASSGYAGYSNDQLQIPTFVEQKKILRIQKARRELGLLSQGELTPTQQTALQNRLLLKRLEKNINSRYEKKHYYEHRAFLDSDLARIQFLRLPTMAQRDRWVEKRGIVIGNKQHSEEITELIKKEDIAVGMSKTAVKDSWGPPKIVEVAGNPMYENERWKYTKYVPKTDGFQKQTRWVYFEGGRVIGWKLTP